jgi:hypothetical protein
MSLIPLPSTFPNNVDIRILPRSDSIMTRQPENFSGEFGAMANRIPAQLRVMVSKAVIILWLIMRQIVKT